MFFLFKNVPPKSRTPIFIFECCREDEMIMINIIIRHDND